MDVSTTASDSKPPPAHKRPPSWPARRKRKALAPDAMLYSMREAAIALGETVQTTRRRLTKSRCTVQIGGAYYTSKGLLRRYLAAIAPELIAAIESRRSERDQDGE